MKKIIATSALALLAGQALGQSFNIDLNNTAGNGAGVPAATYGGAAAQPGTWNSVTSASAAVTGLVGLNGAATGVSFTRATNGMFEGDFDSGVTGNAAKLIQDYQTIDGFGTLQYTFTNLQPGWYVVYTYANRPAGSDSSRSGVTVVGTQSEYQYVGGNLAEDSLIPGTTHAIHLYPVVAGGTLTIKVSDSFWGVANCNGIQIRKLPLEARVRFYVDKGNTGMQDGTSWATAFEDLQTALLAAKAMNGWAAEIWVASGFYYPTQGTDRNASFIIPRAVELYGGFEGNEAALAEREYPWLNITAMSGAIGSGASTDNSYHVVDASLTDGETVIDGFSIASGRASGSGDDAKGGGMMVNNASPLIRNCKFLSNFASNDGGAVWGHGGHPNFVNCLFYNNSTDASGGAVYFHSDGMPRFYNTEFGKNQTDGDGGAVKLLFVEGFFANCFFTGNTASIGNGGAFAMAGDDADDVTMTNCTISLNHSNGISGGVYANNSGDLTLRNCILWGNTDESGNSVADQQHRGNTANGAIISDTFTTIQGEDPDPLFVDANGANNVAGDADDDCSLQPGSPCIDAANSTLLPVDSFDLDSDLNQIETIPFDLLGNPRRRDVPGVTDTGIGAPMADRGAFEFQPCGPDFDGDGFLTGIDFDLFVQAYEAGQMASDWDQDGFITGIDFDLYTQAYEAGC